MTKSLIEHLEAAETKDQLEALAKEMGVEINKRQGVETIRAELVELAEATAQPGEASKADAKPGQAKAAKVEPDETTKAEPDEAAESPGYRGRLLKHTKNGRLFPWTAALAKSRYLKEV